MNDPVADKLTVAPWQIVVKAKAFTAGALRILVAAEAVEQPLEVTTTLYEPSTPTSKELDWPVKFWVPLVGEPTLL